MDELNIEKKFRENGSEHREAAKRFEMSELNIEKKFRERERTSRSSEALRDIL